MNKGMNLPERLRFCFEATIFGKTDEETLDILRKLQTDDTIVSFGKIPMHDYATAALIYLNVISYEENWNENTDYLLEVYSKRPITRCISFLQSSSYTVFNRRLEDFL